MKPCPVCGKCTYKEWEGVYEEYKKLSPDYGECSSCGFTYQEHIRYPLSEQVEAYKKKNDPGNIHKA